MLSDVFSAIRLTCVIAASREICHYLHERDGGCVIIEHAWLVITSLYWNISAARRREEARPSEEAQRIIWRLQSCFFLGSAFIARVHLPETVDRKFALSAEMITLFLPSHPAAAAASSPPPFTPRVDRRQSSLGGAWINQRRRRAPL